MRACRDGCYQGRFSYTVRCRSLRYLWEPKRRAQRHCSVTRSNRPANFPRVEVDERGVVLALGERCALRGWKGKSVWEMGWIGLIKDKDLHMYVYTYICAPWKVRIRNAVALASLNEEGNIIEIPYYLLFLPPKVPSLYHYPTELGARAVDPLWARLDLDL